jgi:hypothetical protein
VKPPGEYAGEADSYVLSLILVKDINLTQSVYSLPFFHVCGAMIAITVVES